MIKPPSLVGLATIGVPTICMILLFLLPFYDRGPERRPERRPIATDSRHRHDRRDGLSDLLRRQRRLADGDRIGHARSSCAEAGGVQLREYEEGKEVVAQSGCEACHKIGDNGNAGPGPELTHIGSRIAPSGDRADACEPDGADALVQEPAAEEVPGGRRLPVAAEVASKQCPVSKAPGRTAGRAARRSSPAASAAPAILARGAWRRRRCGRCSTG